MSKLWDDLKHNMKEWSSAAVEKAEEVSKVAVANVAFPSNIIRYAYPFGANFFPNKR